MLHQLARYAESEGLVTEPGFTAKQVRWAIPCNSEGRPTGTLIDLATPEHKKGRRFPVAPHLTQPELKRAGAGARHFLADNLEVVIGLGASSDKKALAKGEFFRELLSRAASAMPELGEVSKQLSDPAVREALCREATDQKAKPTEIATFALQKNDGRIVYPLEMDDWHDWWRDFRARLQTATKGGRAKSGDRMRCLMTGELVVPAKTQPKVRGLAAVGGISSGDVLASFKQNSFRSYGLVQAQNAAMSEEAAVRYVAALNQLITRGKRLRHSIVAYWFDMAEAAELDPLDLIVGLDNHAEQRSRLRAAARLLDAWRAGKPEARAIGAARYYAYSLSGASGRVMVRDILDGPFSRLLSGLSAWFDDLAIVRRGDHSRLAPPPKFFSVLASTVRDAKDLPPALEGAMWRAALDAGTPFPRDALVRALARARIDAITDKPPRHARFGLIKAVLNRSIRLGVVGTGGHEPVSNGLNEDHPSPAYQSGRIMAVLAALQYRALGDVGAGVVQRYYAAASSSPRLVIGRLLRNANHHLSKLDSPKLRRWYEKKISDIATRIPGEFPANLDLENQSLFALGYYQQQASDRTRTPAKDGNTASEEEQE